MIMNYFSMYRCIEVSVHRCIDVSMCRCAVACPSLHGIQSHCSSPEPFMVAEQSWTKDKAYFTPLLIYLCMYLLVYLFMQLFTYLIYLFNLFIYLFIYLCIYLFYLFVCLLIYLFPTCVSQGCITLGRLKA